MSILTVNDTVLHAKPLPLNAIEKDYILQVLEFHNGNRTHTAKTLKIGIRTLQRKLHRYGRSEYLVNYGNGKTTRNVITPSHPEVLN